MVRAERLLVSLLSVNFGPRYADRAKQIKNKPKVNIDPTELLIQQLKEENERLKKMGGGVGGGEGMTEAEKEEMRKQMEVISSYSPPGDHSWKVRMD